MARRDNNLAPDDLGTYLVLPNQQRVDVEQHPTDFSVLAPAEMFGAALTKAGVAAPVDVPAIAPDIVNPEQVSLLAPGMTRVTTADEEGRDVAMDAVRKNAVAHHIYVSRDTNEELLIDNRILLKLRFNDPSFLEQIVNEYSLVPQGKMGDEYVLKVTEATGANPLKTANRIAAEHRSEVEYCVPQLMQRLEMYQLSLVESHRLFRQQWYLTSDLLSSVDLDPTAGINAPEAWQITPGSPDIVVAVIDDGFDLNHPAFRDKQIHPAQRDFADFPGDTDANSKGGDFHGTSVASIATGSLNSDGMVGVAPGCTFLPIRIGFGPFAPPIDLLQVFRYASQHADVVNCSFGTPPSALDRMTPGFRQEITGLTRSGGRRGKGLVMVFAAGNDDAPTLLRGAENINGVRIVRLGNPSTIQTLPPGSNIFSGYPLILGVIVVGAMTSLKRKAGYSNWGPHITVCAPSNNMHYITRFIRPNADPDRGLFETNYRGLGQIAAVNRAGHGSPFEPMSDDLSTPDFSEQFYTRTFGGTSGAAPVVTGVVALMLSVNPDLTAEQVAQILRASADRDVDTTLDLANDPNVQNKNGQFVAGHSLFFGSGKVNARRAVERALALRAGISTLLTRGSSGIPMAITPLVMPEAVERAIGLVPAAEPLQGTVIATVRAERIIIKATMTIGSQTFLMTGPEPNVKSVVLQTDPSGFLSYTFRIRSDFVGVGWVLTLTKQGAPAPTETVPGVTGQNGIGGATGDVFFS